LKWQTASAFYGGWIVSAADNTLYLQKRVQVGGPGLFPTYRTLMTAITPDGKERWSVPDETFCPAPAEYLAGRLVGNNGVLFTWDKVTKKVLARKPTDGAILWSTDLSATGEVHSVLLDAITGDGTLYARADFALPGFSSEACVLAFGPDGKLKWKTVLPYKNASQLGALTVDCRGNVFLADIIDQPPRPDLPVTRTLHSIGPDGKIRWSRPGLNEVTLGTYSDENLYMVFGTRLVSVAVGSTLADSPWPMPGANPQRTFRSGGSSANHPPAAQPGSVSALKDTAKAVTLVATDADGDALTYSIVTGPAHGTLSGAAPNLTYTPAAGYTGADSFAFKASDGTADSNVAVVSVAVAAVKSGGSGGGGGGGGGGGCSLTGSAGVGGAASWLMPWTAMLAVRLLARRLGVRARRRRRERNSSLGSASRADDPTFRPAKPEDSPRPAR
jgi:outer membrane protein assembly factor BamB